MDFLFQGQLSHEANKDIDGVRGLSRADVRLPKKGQKEGNQVMVGIL